MHGERKNKDQRQRQERLALLGLAADRREPAGFCPDDRAFAELLEAGQDSAELQRFLVHLSACDSCYRKWLAVSEELELADASKTETASWFGRRRALAAVGSACALAVGVMLYLAIDYQPLLKHEAADSGIIPNNMTVPLAEKQSDAPAPEEMIAKPRTFGLAEKEVAKLDDQGIPEERAKVQADKKTMAEVGSALAVKEKAPTRPAAGQMYEADNAPRQADQALAESEAAVVGQQDAAAPVRARFAEKSDALGSYIDLLQDFCAAGEGTEAVTSFAQYAGKGRELLESGELSGAENRKFVEDIVELMEKGAPTEDNASAALCQRVREFTRDKTAGADKNSSGMEQK